MGSLNLPSYAINIFAAKTLILSPNLKAILDAFSLSLWQPVSANREDKVSFVARPSVVKRHEI